MNLIEKFYLGQGLLSIASEIACQTARDGKLSAVPSWTPFMSVAATTFGGRKFAITIFLGAVCFRFRRAKRKSSGLNI